MNDSRGYIWGRGKLFHKPAGNLLGFLFLFWGLSSFGSCFERSSRRSARLTFSRHALFAASSNTFALCIDVGVKARLLCHDFYLFEIILGFPGFSAKTEPGTSGAFWCLVYQCQ